jgi:hypothetical protein
MRFPCYSEVYSQADTTHREELLLPSFLDLHWGVKNVDKNHKNVWKNDTDKYLP